MVPVNMLKFITAAGLSLMVIPTASLQAERSPVFGSATIQALSIEAARDITARGYWADYYGAAAVTLAYNAYIYSYYGRYFAVSNSANEASWYMTAANNAYYAYIYAYYASIYSSAGI